MPVCYGSMFRERLGFLTRCRVCYSRVVMWPDPRGHFVPFTPYEDGGGLHTCMLKSKRGRDYYR